MGSQKAQMVLRGLWMSALFWPYTHGGGFHDAALLAFTPLWLSFGEVFSSWILLLGFWALVVVFETAIEWASLPSLRHFFATFSRSLLVLHHLSFANWNQISAHIATPLLLIGAVLAWQVFRHATNTPRITILLLIGLITLAVNHVFWQLPADDPLFVYALIGLLVLSYHRVLRTLEAQGPSRIIASSIALLSVLVPLSVSWKEAPQPGHAALGFLGGNLQNLRLFSGGATTGYSQGINQIGHSVVPNYKPVMIVHSRHPHYWQAEVFTTFTGKEWLDRPTQAVQVTSKDSGIPLFSLPFNTSQITTSTQTFTVQTADGQPFRTLFYPGVPISIHTGPSSLVLYPGKEQFVASHIRSYRVTSIVPHFNPVVLNNITFGEYPRPKLKPDLQTPRNLSPRVATLARQITRHAKGPWQAAMDIKQYLDSHYRYSFHVTPTRTDVVNHFLFTNKQGYCDQFSTAFIMMLRSVGVPARWVAGYAPGQYSPRDHGYLIRAIDAHSWAQVYISPYGWVPVDPTPGYSIPTVKNTSSSSSVSSTKPISVSHTHVLPPVHYAAPPGVNTHQGPAKGGIKHSRTLTSRRSKSQSPWPWLLSLVGVLAALGVSLFARNRKSNDSEPERLWRLIKWWTGIRLRVSIDALTPRQWLRLWMSFFACDPDACRNLALSLERGLYSEKKWSEGDAVTARRLWHGIRFAHKKSATSPTEEMSQ